MGEGRCQEERQRTPTPERKFLESPESGMMGQNGDRGRGTDACNSREFVDPTINNPTSRAFGP